MVAMVIQRDKIWKMYQMEKNIVTGKFYLKKY
jgi:hypothetical protein